MVPRWSLVACVLALVVASGARAQTARAQTDGEAGPTLAFGGDVLYDAPLHYQLGHRARTVGREAALREVFVDLTPHLQGADLAVVNLEVPISMRYRTREAGQVGPVFRAPVDFLTALREAGVDAVTVANNHAYDQGIAGLANTLDATRRERVMAIGVGDDAEAAAAAQLFDVGGARVAIAAWSEGSNHRPSHDEAERPRIAFVYDDTIERSLARARPEADLVIAMFHWVREDLVEPRPIMRELAQRAADAGADLVIGHGTHLPGQTERIRARDGREVRVVYSLGNLLAAMEEPAGTLESREVGVRDAPLVFVRTRRDGARLAITALEIRPHWIARPMGTAPWLASGSLPVSRTVDLSAELERLRATDCGEPCAQRADAYRRRMALTLAAMSERETGAPAPRVASAPRERRPPARIDARAPPERIAADDPRLQPFVRGTDLGVRFDRGQAREASIDERALRSLAGLLREDRGLRVEVTGYATADELTGNAGLGSLRARRVKGLIAILGPSRSRFVVRAAVGTAAVRVRVTRTGS